MTAVVQLVRLLQGSLSVGLWFTDTHVRHGGCLIIESQQVFITELCFMDWNEQISLKQTNTKELVWLKQE
jgi:hypothetical protein